MNSEHCTWQTCALPERYILSSWRFRFLLFWCCLSYFSCLLTTTWRKQFKEGFVWFIVQRSSPSWRGKLGAEMQPASVGREAETDEGFCGIAFFPWSWFSALTAIACTRIRIGMLYRSHGPRPCSGRQYTFAQAFAQTSSAPYSVAWIQGGFSHLS